MGEESGVDSIVPTGLGDRFRVNDCRWPYDFTISIATLLSSHLSRLNPRTPAFKILTRRYTLGHSPSSCEELTDIALKLRERVSLDAKQRSRLVGIGLSNFQEPEDKVAQPGLFE
jgi:hypothetical protein